MGKRSMGCRNSKQPPPEIGPRCRGGCGKHFFPQQARRSTTVGKDFRTTFNTAVLESGFCEVRRGRVSECKHPAHSMEMCEACASRPCFVCHETELTEEQWWPRTGRRVCCACVAASAEEQIKDPKYFVVRDPVSNRV